MNDPLTLDDCIKAAKANVLASLEGGANALRRNDDEVLTDSAIHEAAERATPALSDHLLAVFSSANHLWFNDPESGYARHEHGVMGAISRVVYDAINTALWEWANALDGDTLVCEAADCGFTDDHEPCPNEAHCIACRAATDVRCKAHCGGVGACERCAVALVEEVKSES